MFRFLARKLKPVFDRLGDTQAIVETHSFCETSYAAATSPWHIRRLTSKGRKLGGGADTPSLCGLQVSWDLQTTITEHHLTHCCKTCANLMKEDLYGTSEDEYAIENDQQLAQVQEQLGRVQMALETIRREVLPKNATRYKLMAEGYIDQISRLRKQIDRYQNGKNQEKEIV